MAFRRYGGDIDHPTRSGGNVNFFVWVVITLTISVLLTFLFSEPLFLVLGIPLSILFLILTFIIPGGGTSGIKEKRQQILLKKAVKCLESQDFDNAKKYLERAKVHGEIPAKYKNSFVKLGQ